MAPTNGIQARRILIIDDNEDFIATLSYWLQAKGHRVMTAINCEAGLKIVESTTLDIIFLDMQMPNVNGVETLRRIRKTHKDLPVVIVTAFPNNEMVREAYKYGLNGVFPKDGGFENLAEVMEEVLKK